MSDTTLLPAATQAPGFRLSPDWLATLLAGALAALAWAGVLPHVGW